MQPLKPFNFAVDAAAFSAFMTINAAHGVAVTGAACYNGLAKEAWPVWVLFAFGSAAFAGLTAVLAKIGVRDVDSNLATALRTVVVLAFSWLMVFVAGAWQTLSTIDGRSLLFLALSGVATGASWL